MHAKHAGPSARGGGYVGGVSSDELERRYERGLSIAAFASHTRDALAGHGFTPGNSLALVGVCRDELMFPAEQALHDVWGAAFDISSLAGMVFLGRSGLAAAASHAPGIDGRRRYIHVVMPHIGLGDDGTVGVVVRDGQAAPSSACGALVGLQRELNSGPLELRLDPDDLEMSLLRSAFAGQQALLTGVAPDLVALTEMARTIGAMEVLRLSKALLASDTTDVALFSALLIHGPHGDRVAIEEACVYLGAVPDAVTL